MARLKWTENQLAQLKKYGRKGEFHTFATIFKCTENAAKIKYGRLNRATSFSGKIDAIVKASAKKLDLKTNNNPWFKALSVQKPGEKNPFEITQ